MKTKIRLIGLVGLILGAGPAMALDIVTGTVTVTNAPTTNGQTITINGSVRTWTNAVVNPGSEVLTNSTVNGAATNLFNELANYPVGTLTLAHAGTNAISLKTAPGV